MTADDLRRIEGALAIRLPESYRTRMLAFPIPAAAGNSDLSVWDDADRVIALNQELRRGRHRGVRPWPLRLLRDVTAERRLSFRLGSRGRGQRAGGATVNP
ncbi:MAG: hypothetical protein ABW221_27685 [Vicinamibacteria bacterium]